MKLLHIALLFSLPLYNTIIKADHYNLGERSEMLESTIAFLDGHHGRIDGEIFGLMASVRQKIQTLVFGVRDTINKNKRVGQYLFKGTAYTVHELVTLEETYHNDPEFITLLEQVKIDFENLVSQFISSARGTKQYLIHLIEESCKRRNRMDSILLTWADAKEEDETALFKTQVTSFKELNLFCSDLMNFLEDLMVSCPKAMGQFKALRDKYSQTHQK